MMYDINLYIEILLKVYPARYFNLSRPTIIPGLLALV